jgi:hypothetical protein
MVFLGSTPIGFLLLAAVAAEILVVTLYKARTDRRDGREPDSDA